jgi:DNA-binding transcriptional LysR family regulator
MNLDLDTFRVLVAVVEHGSFAKAAEHLCRAQSAVSYKVKKLEEAVGQQVFDRDGYRATLTDTGKLLLKEGQKLLGQVQHIENLLHQGKSGWEYKLDLVIDGVLPIRPILKALRDLEHEQIPTRVQLQVEYLSGVQYQFEHADAELMIAIDYKRSEHLQSIPLPNLVNTLVVARTHPLAAKSQVTVENLQQYVELTIRDTWKERQQAAKSGQPLFGGDRVYFLSDFQQKKEALKMGVGFGWMPSYMIFDELMSNELVAIDLIDDNPRVMTPHLVYRLDKPLGKTAKWLIENIQRYYFRAFSINPTKI